MKNIKIITSILCTVLFFSACNEEWVDELYPHMVSLKAPIGSGGVSDVYIRYQPNGEVIYDLPVLRSGLTLSDKAVDVQIGVDNDTLDILNQEKFLYRTDLYYKQLPAEYFELESQTCHIPGGSNKELYKVKFKFSNLDLSEEWVLPLTIEDNPAYISNTRKGINKALLHILPFNDYSGNYSATAMNIYFTDSNDAPLVVDKRRAHVVDERTVFFYAGTKEDNAIDRAVYKINVTFEEGIVDEKGKTRGNLTLSAVNPLINFQIVAPPTYEIWKEDDPVHPYIEHWYYTIRMSYKYDDITTVPNHTISYHAEGSLTMERKINTLIPDRDQAILW